MPYYSHQSEWVRPRTAYLAPCVRCWLGGRWQGRVLVVPWLAAGLLTPYSTKSLASGYAKPSACVSPNPQVAPKTATTWNGTASASTPASQHSQGWPMPFTKLLVHLTSSSHMSKSNNLTQRPCHAHLIRVSGCARERLI